MLDKFNSSHWHDKDKNPEGGASSGRGFAISWQKGPLGLNEERSEPNGAFVETIIAAAKDRLEYYQQSKFNCWQNQEAIAHLTSALFVLNSRTEEREARGVEGTHKI